MTPLSIRLPLPADRDPIHWIAASAGGFSPAELEAALALFDAAVEDGAAAQQVCVLEDAGIPAGFACYGPTPRTEGTWQLHAIAVEHAAQGKGYGRHMLAYVESEVRRGGGRLMLVESRSAEGCARANAFYERTAYTLVARIPAFYRPGEDKLVFAKTLEASSA
ncbi:MAG TPA: GNAT family N-acetyltransferase [Longimicrobiales bacterium]